MALKQKTAIVVLNAQPKPGTISNEGAIVLGNICKLLETSAKFKTPIGLVEYKAWGVSYPVSPEINQDVIKASQKEKYFIRVLNYLLRSFGSKGLPGRAKHFIINYNQHAPTPNDPSEGKCKSEAFPDFIKGFSRVIVAGTPNAILAMLNNPAIEGKEVVTAKSIVSFGKENKEPMLAEFKAKASEGKIKFFGRDMQPLLDFIAQT